MIEQRATPSSFALLYRGYIPGDERLGEVTFFNDIPVAIIKTDPGNLRSDHILNVSGLMPDGSTGVLFQDLHFGSARWSSDQEKNGQITPAPAVDLLYDVAAQADWHVSIGDYGEFLNRPARRLIASQTWKRAKERSQAVGMSPGILVEGNHDGAKAVEKWQQEGRFVTGPVVTRVFPTGGLTIAEQTAEHQLSFATAAEIDKEMGQVFACRGQELLRYSASQNRLTLMFHGDQLALNATDPSMISRIVHHIPEVFFKPLAWSMQQVVELYGEDAYAEIFKGEHLRQEAFNRFLKGLPKRELHEQSPFEQQVERFRPALPPEFSVSEKLARTGVVYSEQHKKRPFVIQLAFGHFHAYAEVAHFDDVSLPDNVLVYAYNGGYHVPGHLRVGVDDGQKIVGGEIFYDDSP